MPSGACIGRRHLTCPGCARTAGLQLGGLSRDSGLASGDIVEAYVHDDALNSVVDDYLLSPAAAGGNVVMHVVPAGREVYPRSLRCSPPTFHHRGPARRKRADRTRSARRTTVSRGTVTILPAMGDAQAASWHGLMDVYEHLPTGWTTIGGQMVHLHCAERESFPTATDRRHRRGDRRPGRAAHAEPIHRHPDRIGFTPDGDLRRLGLAHRWRRGSPQLDVLLPEGIGERAAARTGVTGSPTLPTPGGTQALHRSEPIEITVEGRIGSVLRPTLVGALIAKAAAHTSPGDSARQRHRYDFATLASLIAATDFRNDPLTSKDRRRLTDMVSAVQTDAELTAAMPDAAEWMDRLVRAAQLA